MRTQLAKDISMAEWVRNGYRAVGIVTGLACDRIRSGDRTVLGIAPIFLVFAVTKQMIKHLVDERTRVKRDGCAKDVQGGLHHG